MADDKKQSELKDKSWKKMNRGGPTGAIYGMGFIGALIYYIQHATTFWLLLVGIVKSIFWPAVLVYKVLEMLKL